MRLPAFYRGANICHAPLHHAKAVAQNFHCIDTSSQKSFYYDDIGGKLDQAAYRRAYRSSSPYSI